MNTMWYIVRMGFYLTMKRDKTLKHATAWMHLKDTMQSERGQT